MTVEENIVQTVASTASTATNDQHGAGHPSESKVRPSVGVVAAMMGAAAAAGAVVGAADGLAPVLAVISFNHNETLVASVGS
jgi:hypothetical protein